MARPDNPHLQEMSNIALDRVIDARKRLTKFKELKKQAVNYNAPGRTIRELDDIMKFTKAHLVEYEPKYLG